MLAWERLRRLFVAVCGADGAPQTTNTPFTLSRVYSQDIPALIFANRWLILFTTGSFFAGLAAGVALAVSSPAATAEVLSAVAAQFDRLGGAEGITTAAVLRNNLRIAFLSPLLALLSLGVYPLLVTLLPGVILGMLVVQIEAPVFVRAVTVLALVAPHGIFELPAVFVGSALSLRFAWSIFRPVPALSAMDNVLWAAVNVVKGYVFFVIPLVFLAAWVEVEVTVRVARWLASAFGSLGAPQL